MRSSVHVLCRRFPTSFMKLADAKSLAKSKMVEHGIVDWDFQFDNAKRRHGYCAPRMQIISLSKHFVKLNSEKQVLDTILHEISHALHYIETETVSHNKRWKEIAKMIGCSGLRLTIANMPQGKYTGTCPSCKRKIRAHKRSRVSCGQCSNHFNPNFLIQWK